MAAKKSGGTAARQREKNSAMAAMMKAQGIKRTTTRCPVCHKLIGIDGLYHHVGKPNCH